LIGDRVHAEHVERRSGSARRGRRGGDGLVEQYPVRPGSRLRAAQAGWEHSFQHQWSLAGDERRLLDIQDHSTQAGPRVALGAWGAIPAAQGIVESNEIPYQEWALAKKKENYEKRLKVDPADFSLGDPELKCDLPGVPRANYLLYSIQIIPGTNRMLISYEYADASRLANMETHVRPPIDSFMGWSNGQWEGDTLVITVTDFNDKTWFDRAGNFHSEELKVVERYTPSSPDTYITRRQSRTPRSSLVPG
jgi:hypothetical protein